MIDYLIEIFEELVKYGEGDKPLTVSRFLDILKTIEFKMDRDDSESDLIGSDD